jgi:hypothetical protein
VRGSGNDTLGGRVHHGQGVAVPRPACLRIRRPGPDVDHRLAAAIHADGRADITVTGEIAGKRLGHLLESRRYRSLNRDAHLECLP